METNKFGKEAIFVGSILGGNVAGAVASSKVKFLGTNLGRMVLVAAGLTLAVKAKSDILKGAAIGLALSGATPFVQKLANDNSVAGLMGVAGSYGVGDIIEGPDGMMYMVNGMGELEPYANTEYEEYLEGDDVNALASVADETAVLA